MQSSHSPKRRLSRRSFARLFSLAISNAKRHPRSVAVGLLASILLSLVVGSPAVGYGARSDWTTAIKVRDTGLARSVKAAVSPAAVTTKPPNMAPPTDDTVTVLTFIPTGSYIIDMGQATQTVANGLKPFGLIYALVINNKVPVLWAINPAKAYGGTDFTYNAKNYIGGPFIIPADFVTAAAVTTINTWKAKGVVVDGPTVSPILNVPVYDRITSFPKTVINTTNAGIASDFYGAAEIPSAAFRTALPAGLTACDDVFTMPHADPTWILHSSLIPFVNGGGFFWAGCHAVSVFEAIDDPGDADAFPNINFLSTNGLALYNGNPSHKDGTAPYTKDPTLAGHPIMQYLGTTDAAHQNGSEQIYLTDTVAPRNWGSVWRPTTKVAVYDPDHVNLVGGSSDDISTDKAAAIVFGRGFGNPTAGFVMYEGGHDVGGADPENVAAVRAYFNFILLAGIHFRPELTFNVPATIVQGQTYQFNVNVTGGTPPFTYAWTSSCGGTFSPNATTQNPIFTAPGAPPRACTINLTLTDSCNRLNFTASASQLAATAVDFAGFAARSYERGVELEWSTGYETSNLGFNLYRDRSGERERLNSSLIAGSALMIGAESKLLSGNSYRWWDSRPDAAGSTYWVESIDLNGTSQWHGPYSVMPGDGREPRSRPTRPVMLSEVNELLPNSVTDTSGSHSVEPHAELPALDSPLRATQQKIAALPAVKIGVDRAGWYRLTQQQLLSAGLSPGINPRRLQLFVDGGQVPISVTGEQDGKLDPGDTVEFYGLPLDTPSTAERTYWLTEGSALGRRVPQSSLTGGATAPSSYPQTVERDERGIYFSNLLNGDAENYFGALVRNAPTEQLLTLTQVDAAAGGQAELEIAVQGVTVQPHRVRVSLNGTAVTTLDFYGKALGSTKVQVAQSLVRDGSNSVILEAELGSGDLSLVDYVRLTYSRKYLADSNRVFASVPGGTRVKIGGFTASDVRVFDVGDPKAVVELTGTVSGGNGEFGIEVTTNAGGTKKLFAVLSSSVQSPSRVKANAVSQLGSYAGKGNLFVVTHSTLTEALKPLIDQRRRDGWRVVVADVEDVYDEYSFGHKDPGAVREWLRAMNTKSRTLSYLLLAGDGSFDPRNYLGFGDSDLVPAKSIDTDLSETVSDDWFGDFDGDGLSEMAVGRLPARTAAELSAMVTKILSYDRGSSGQGATLISDFNDTYNFLGTSNSVKGFLPQPTAVDMIISGQTADVRGQLLESLNKGPKLVNYAGHGSVDLWRYNIFTSADALALTSSGKVGVYLMMTCLNGYYQAPNIDCLGESLLKAPGGAVAVWASSGFTEPTDQEKMDAVMVKTLYGSSGVTVGRAIYSAKMAIGDPDVRRTWILLGDPTMVY